MNQNAGVLFVSYYFYGMEKIISSGSALELWQGFRIGGRKNR
jgi:hypothetical protein